MTKNGRHEASQSDTACHNF